MLENGGCPGKAPIGYDLYGKKLSNPKFYSPTKRVEISEFGEKLKLAWKWKLSGERGYISSGFEFDILFFIASQ
ncbi:hypothetical protein [Hyunsoonleella ulvae]|uniref:hypothetical protein n=1 Tax=Hyunsoonleella ulvae TaxID=2799948 RepID=UPI001939AADC|nr:hypothetical protein [Hyunsoonleella ulvae]